MEVVQGDLPAEVGRPHFQLRVHEFWIEAVPWEIFAHHRNVEGTGGRRTQLQRQDVMSEKHEAKVSLREAHVEFELRLRVDAVCGRKKVRSASKEIF